MKCSGLVSKDLLGEDFGQFRGDVSLPTQAVLNRSTEVFFLAGFVEIAGGTGFQSTHSVVFDGIDAQYQHFGVRMGGDDLLEKVQTLALSQRYVEKNEVPLFLVQQPSGLGDLSRSTERDARKALFENLGNPSSNDGVIIDYKDFHQGIFSCPYWAPLPQPLYKM